MSSQRPLAGLFLFAWLAVVGGAAAHGCAASKGEDATPRRDSSVGGDAEPEDTGAPLADGELPPEDSSVPGTDSATPADTLASDTGGAATDSGVGATDGAVDSKPPPVSVLQIAPADTVLTLVGGTAKRTFAAKLVAPDGTTTDLTSKTAFSIVDGTLGSFAGATFTATKAGKSTIQATTPGYAASTPITVTGPSVIIGPGATADAPTKFGGTVDSTASPSFVYPANGTLVPPNMNVFEFHFLPGAGNTLFELSFTSASVDTKVYFGCTAVGSGCVYTPDATVWKLVAEGGRGGDPVSYKLRGVNAASPGKVGVSATRAMSFGLEDIVGGIYYWNAKIGATMRYEFGVSGKAGETYMNAASAGATTCVGCHVLSRPGHRIAVGLDIPAPSPYKVYDVASKGLIFSAGTAFGGGSNFFSFSPDETKVLTSNGIGIGYRNAVTGAVITDPLVAAGTMPDWSPDGSRAVYAKPQTPPPCIGFCGAAGVEKASLQVMPFDGTKWGASTTLVPYSGQNNYYPAYSPDGAWVIFNRSPSDLGSYDAKDAEVWVVASSGGTPIKLTTGSTGGDSWPKWTAAMQAYKSGGLVWVTFSSRRAYGLRLAAGSTAQIWMTAFDPAKAKAGADPSYPAFWLPFQDGSSGNHIAQWVTKVDRKPCKESSECPFQACIDGFCKPMK
ncbi:MAG: PD40 domain-containing protein [Deltaproteobacteria bacterium]|nr:PD40 domain-containing protein [Deltaproteobacteria bacterium]